MDGIDQLQSLSRKLKDIYNNLDRYQTDIVTSAFGSGQDLSYNSLLKFAPLAENFQQYADNYKNELNKFQKLLNSVQQTGKRQAHEQRQAEQQQPIVSKPVVTAQPSKQAQPISTQTQSAVVTIPRDPINTIKPNGNSNNVTVTATVPHPSKKPLISSNNNNNNNGNNASSINITRKSAQIRNPNTVNVNVNTNNNNINQQTATSTYYQPQQTEYNRIAPQRQVVNSNASNMVNNNAPKTSIPSSKPNINQQRQAPVSPNKTGPVSVSASVSTSGTTSTTTSTSVSISRSNVNNNTNQNTNNERSSKVSVVRTASNISSAPKIVKTYSQPRNNPNNNISSQQVVGGMQDIYTKDLIASSQILDSYSSRRQSYREQERMRKERQKQHQPLSPEELKAARRKKKREANRRRIAKKKAAEQEQERQERQEESLSPQALNFDNNNYNEYNRDVSYGFNDAIDVGFDIEDSKDIRDQHAHFQVQNIEMQRAEREFEQQNAFRCVTLKEIEKPKIIKNKYSYQYVPSQTRFDQVWDGKEKYTTTMLRFQGFYGLEENNDEDKKKVQKQIIQEMKFKPEQVDWTKIRIKKDRSWCIVEVKAPGKYIKDMLKKQKRKNDRIFQINRQNREKERKRQFGNNSSQDESDADHEPIPKPKPIYRITEYERRNNTQDQIESTKLYILNFDILNKKCHKALTNLFLRFGDLRDHLEMGITQRDDPYAKVDYKNIEDARAVWEFQNRNGNPEQRIHFGSRILTILYARH